MFWPHGAGGGFRFIYLLFFYFGKKNRMVRNSKLEQYLLALVRYSSKTIVSRFLFMEKSSRNVYLVKLHYIKQRK